jgi:hypothetical protein
MKDLATAEAMVANREVGLRSGGERLGVRAGQRTDGSPSAGARWHATIRKGRNGMRWWWRRRRQACHPPRRFRVYADLIAPLPEAEKAPVVRPAVPVREDA